MSDDIDMRPIRSGAYLIHRSTKPRSRHDTFSAAERECGRLLTTDPDGTYIISREEARVCRSAPAHEHLRTGHPQPHRARIHKRGSPE